MKLFAIFDLENMDWLRELPSRVDDGGEAILVFTSIESAMERGAKHWGYSDFQDCLDDHVAKVACVSSYREIPRSSNRPLIILDLDGGDDPTLYDPECRG